MVKYLYFIYWFTVRKSKCYFTFWSRSIIKGNFPWLSSQPAVSSRSCFALPECFAKLSTYEADLRSRQIKYKAHQDVPALMYFSMRSAQRLESLWSYCLKMTFQNLICKSSSETSLLGSNNSKFCKGVLKLFPRVLMHGYNQRHTGWHNFSGTGEDNGAAQFLNILFYLSFTH